MAKLKPKVAKIEDVEEAYRGAYEEANGEFVLQIDGTMPGTVSAGELATFRDSNIALKAANEALQTGKTAAEAALAGVDLVEYEDLKKKKAKLDDKQTLPMDQVQKAITDAVKPIQDQVTTLTDDNKAKDAALQEAKLAKALGAGARKQGAREAALDFILKQAESDGWELDGEMAVQKRDGTPVFSRDKPTEIITSDEYFLDVAQALPWAFEGSPGGGGTGDGDPTPAGAVRIIPAGTKWTDQDMQDVAAGKAREAS